MQHLLWTLPALRRGSRRWTRVNALLGPGSPERGLPVPSNEEAAQCANCMETTSHGCLHVWGPGDTFSPLPGSSPWSLGTKEEALETLSSGGNGGHFMFPQQARAAAWSILVSPIQQKPKNIPRFRPSPQPPAPHQAPAQPRLYTLCPATPFSSASVPSWAPEDPELSVPTARPAEDRPTALL